MELLMGNEAVAMGALAAGVSVVTGYPGTPSTEVLETVAKRNPGFVHVEWSVNEKVAMEVAAGAAYCGARVMVTMKQVGLNVASDPLMSLNYIGVKGAMVVLVADDPGPISSQTEQDTRRFAQFAKIPVFDPSSPEEAYEMIGEAFEFSHKYKTPVFFRMTTRVCHACATVKLREIPPYEKPQGFEKDPRWVIFPKLSYNAKLRLEAREKEFSNLFSSYTRNEIIGGGKIGIACGSISYAYVHEALRSCKNDYKILKIATPYPFPNKLASEFLKSVDKVVVFEELDSVIEDALVNVAGKEHINIDINGKKDESVPCAGELSSMTVENILHDMFEAVEKKSEITDMPKLPVRPPVLCAGCPHRASFYAVKKAMAGEKAVFCGDIGCYTLGNAQPLNMVDTCLCMGAAITVAQGVDCAENGSVNFGFVGDSTFFASGIPGVINAVYNKNDMVLCVLDNSTTAMTGHQTHPGIGRTVMGDIAPQISIPAILKAVGVDPVYEVNPFELDETIKAVKDAAGKKGVRAIVFKSPCIALFKKTKTCAVGSDCIGCKKCIKEIGCPALSFKDKKAVIDKSLCNGCGLCAEVCPKKCIGEVK